MLHMCEYVVWTERNSWNIKEISRSHNHQAISISSTYVRHPLTYGIRDFHDKRREKFEQLEREDRDGKYLSGKRN